MALIVVPVIDGALTEVVALIVDPEIDGADMDVEAVIAGAVTEVVALIVEPEIESESDERDRRECERGRSGLRLKRWYALYSSLSLSVSLYLSVCGA